MMALPLMLVGCKNTGKVSGREDLSADSVDEDFMTQAEINEAYYNDRMADADSIEKEFQTLMEALPQCKANLILEKTAWEKYQDAVREVAGYGDHGSSTPMYVSDVLGQGYILRRASFRNLLLYIQGVQMLTSKTTFTDTMIADAYSAFVEAVGSDDYIENKTDCQESLRNEQKCWNEWMACRASVSKTLSDKLRAVYDDCTNRTMRTKLMQLKNQNQCLGLVSSDMINCALPDDCSDRELLEYPGFDKEWEKYLKEFE